MRRRSRVLATARRLATLRVASFGTRNRGFVFPGISETTADSRAGADAVRGDDWRVRTADASARSRDPRRSRPTTSRARGSPRSAAHPPPRASADRRSPPSPPHPRGVFLFRTDETSKTETKTKTKTMTKPKRRQDQVATLLRPVILNTMSQALKFAKLQNECNIMAVMANSSQNLLKITRVKQ